MTASLCLALFQSVVIADETDIVALNKLAQEYERTGKHAEADQIYRHIMSINAAPKIHISDQKKDSLKPVIKTKQKTITTHRLTSAQRDDQTIANGFKAVEENKLETALQYFDSVLKHRPKNTESLYGKALVYEKLKQYDKIVDVLARKVTVIDDPKVSDLYNRAKQLTTATDTKDENSTKKMNTQAYDSELKKGENLLKKNNLVEAEMVFQKLYLQNPLDSQLLLHLGEIYSRLNQFSKAKEYYQSTLSYSPENIYALEGLAQTHYALQEYKQSLTIYEKIDRKKWNSDLDYNYKMTKVAYYLDLKEYKKAQAFMEELYVKYPARLDVLRNMANITSRNSLEDSIRYRTAVYQKTRAVDDLIPLLYSLLDANRFTQAETFFNSLRNKSLTIKEKNELKKLYLLYYSKLSTSQLTQGDFEAAEQTSRSGLIISQDDASLSENLGWSLLNQGKPDQALKIFDTLLLSKPTASLYYAAALAAYNVKERKKAYGYLFKASKTNDIDLLKKIAQLYENMGSLQESLDTIKTIEEIQASGYKKTNKLNDSKESLPSKTTNPSLEKNDYNGMYNPFLSQQVNSEVKKKQFPNPLMS